MKRNQSEPSTPQIELLPEGFFSASTTELLKAIMEREQPPSNIENTLQTEDDVPTLATNIAASNSDESKTLKEFLGTQAAVLEKIQQQQPKQRERKRMARGSYRTPMPEQNVLLNTTYPTPSSLFDCTVSTNVLHNVNQPTPTLPFISTPPDLALLSNTPHQPFTVNTHDYSFNPATPATYVPVSAYEPQTTYPQNVHDFLNTMGSGINNPATPAEPQAIEMFKLIEIGSSTLKRQFTLSEDQTIYYSDSKPQSELKDYYFYLASIFNPQHSENLEQLENSENSKQKPCRLVILTSAQETQTNNNKDSEEEAPINKDHQLCRIELSAEAYLIQMLKPRQTFIKPHPSYAMQSNIDNLNLGREVAYYPAEKLVTVDIAHKQFQKNIYPNAIVYGESPQQVFEAKNARYECSPIGRDTKTLAWEANAKVGPYVKNIFEDKHTTINISKDKYKELMNECSSDKRYKSKLNFLRFYFKPPSIFSNDKKPKHKLFKQRKK